MSSSAHDPSGPSRRSWRHPKFGGFRFSASELLLSLTLLILASPWIEHLTAGDYIDNLLLTLVMIAGVLAVGARRRTLLIAIALVVPTILLRWLALVDPGSVPPPAYLLPTMVFFGFVIWQTLRFIHAAPRVDSNVLCAGISGYLMLGLFWIPGYLLAANQSPNAFSFPADSESGRAFDSFTALYFSYSTLCTLGYGDVAPLSRFARTLAISEGISGVLYVAILISRLVSMHTATAWGTTKT